MTIILGFILSIFVYAFLDHWRGGARLFRGKKNAEAAEKFAMTNGKEGYRTWYWDMGVLPYVAFGIYTFALVYVLVGLTWASSFVASYLCGTYYWFRSQSPREVFPAGNGQAHLDISHGIYKGGVLGVLGLLPAAIIGAVSIHWLLILTPILGAPLGWYHNKFYGNPLFRSYGELCQGGLIVAPFVIIHIWAALA